MTGKVKFFKDNKGYGFITGEDGRDYYVNKGHCIDSIRQDDKVEFEPSNSQNAWKFAINVRNITFDM